MKTVFRFLRPYRGDFSRGMCLKIISTLLELALPFILSHILKTVVQSMCLKQVFLWGLVMLLCTLLSCMLGILAHRIAMSVGRRFTESLRRQLFSKSLRLSARQTEYFTVPSLESRITTDTYNVHQFINMIQRLGVRAPIMMVGSIVITLCMDAGLAVVMLVIIPFAMSAVFLISRFSILLYDRVQQGLDQLVRVLREDAHGIRIIKALSRESYEQSRFDFFSRELCRREHRVGYLTSCANPLMTFLMNLGIVAVITVSVDRVANGRSDPETVLAFMQYFTQIAMAMIAMTRIHTISNKCIASARRIEEVLLAGDEMEEASPDLYPPSQNTELIRFENVDFSYPGGGKALENITFTLGQGQSLGIIGATGSGKSTLIRLLLRFYDVTGGQIRIFGKDIRTIPRQELYSLFGTALQNDFLYSGTVRENIAFGRDIAPEDLTEAAGIAQARDFISGFPEGYDHQLTPNASNLSGGQKQRLLIARALAGNPRILILDDACSALDYRTEAAFRHSLETVHSGAARIIVAQRISTIQFCDCILMLHKGKIAGLGSHDTLIRSCPEYRALVESQAGGEILD